MYRSALFLCLCLSLWSCSSLKRNEFKPKQVFQSDPLKITQISENVFVHVSYIQTNDFGKVPCNGLVLRNGSEAVVLDTPTNDSCSEVLINWIEKTLNCRIVAVVPTHFHNDCLGGLKAFHQHNIASYAHAPTIELATANQYEQPKNGFKDSMLLKLGSESVLLKYFGEGHTKDNLVAHFRSEQVLFGGCLIKELGAGKGYLGDANIAEWSNTVEKVKKAFPDVRIVVPGHGKSGSQKLLDYTIDLFRQ